MARGQSYVREEANPALAAELREILAHPDPRCLVCIPSMDKRSPKIANWEKRQGAFLPLLSPDVTYGSSWITRPDSAPWVISPAYADAMIDLWRGRKVTIVCEPTSKLLTVLKGTARKWVHLPCPSHGAYAHIDEYERQILKGHPDVALLSHGVSATCLAHRLACKGQQALDLGSVGGFLVRMIAMRTHPYPLYPAVLHHPDCADNVALQAQLEASGFTVVYCGERL